MVATVEQVRAPSLPERELRARILLQHYRMRVERFGVGWRVVGSGVDTLVSDLWIITPAEVERLVFGR
ncbi:MAG: hypothetical protein ROZ64_18245 [Burkholderiaceae bacterium]|jgi:hypothetical protein|nr:hypothetical protein [Burkholderiaceae bacterium]